MHTAATVHGVPTARAAAGSSNPARSLSAVFAVVFAALLVVASPVRAGPSDRELPETHPAALWRAFPLREVPSSPLLPPTRAGDVRRAAPALPPAVVRSDGKSPWVFPAGLAVLLALGAAGAVLALRGPAQRWSRAATAAGSRGRLEGGEGFRLTPTVPGRHAYVLYLPGPGGWWGDQLVEREGALPVPGEIIVDDELGRAGQAYAVDEVGPSPLPEDDRPCARLRAL